MLQQSSSWLLTDLAGTGRRIGQNHVQLRLPLSARIHRLLALRLEAPCHAHHEFERIFCENTLIACLQGAGDRDTLSGRLQVRRGLIWHGFLPFQDETRDRRQNKDFGDTT